MSEPLLDKIVDRELHERQKTRWFILAIVIALAVIGMVLFRHALV